MPYSRWSSYALANLNELTGLQPQIPLPATSFEYVDPENLSTSHDPTLGLQAYTPVQDLHDVYLIAVKNYF